MILKLKKILKQTIDGTEEDLRSNRVPEDSAWVDHLQRGQTYSYALTVDRLMRVAQDRSRSGLLWRPMSSSGCNLQN